MCAMKSTMPFVDRGDIEKVKLSVDDLVSGRRMRASPWDPSWASV